jgi:hypothetical protein
MYTISGHGVAAQGWSPSVGADVRVAGCDAPDVMSSVSSLSRRFDAPQPLRRGVNLRQGIDQISR